MRTRHTRTIARHALAASIACAATALAAPASAQTAGTSGSTVDIVTLNDGKTIQAPILKETADMVWVDLGVSVVSIPKKDVASILRADDSADLGVDDDEGLFRTASSALPERSPREHAQRIGGAVIKVSTPSGLGSGFIIHPDGYAITNAHVIQGETKIKATVFEQGDIEFKRVTVDDVEIIAVNNHTDLALIKLTHPEGETFPTVYVQGAESLDAGEEVFAIGNPLGLERSLSSGVVATTNRNFEGLTFVQTTAEINPGNSGGPLFNMRGEVIGVINMGALFADGVGFAIPARYVRDFIRNREAFAYDKENPNSGYAYKAAPPRVDFSPPDMLDDATGRGD